MVSSLIVEIDYAFVSIISTKNSLTGQWLTFALQKIYVMKILMVCLGNICRSPLAEGILQHKANDAGLNWTVDSAGTNSYHIGEAPHHLSQKVAKLNGVDICNQKARRFVKEDVERYDKIYAMADDVLDDIRQIAKEKYDPAKIDLFLNELYPEENKSVPDPWYGTEPGYHEVYKIIDEACNSIISKYENSKMK
jgi:protein-tyrosine phosphatase